MSKIETQYVGPPITINTIRGFILDNNLTEADTVLLHPDDAELLQSEFKSTYSEPLPDYYFLLGVFVEKDAKHQVPFDYLAALRNDDRPHRLVIAEARAIPEHAERSIYRCGWCGTYTDATGYLITGEKLEAQTTKLNMRGLKPHVNQVHGMCCVHKWRS